MPITPLTPEQAMRLAAGHYRAGRWAEAEALCRQMLAREPNHGEALHLLGVMAGQGGRNDLAVELIGRATQAKPDWAKAHYDLGYALQCAGKLEEASASYRRAIELKPDWMEAWNNLGAALQKTGRTAEAIAAFGRAIKLRPGESKAHNNLGNALRDAGRFEESLAALGKAIALKPNSGEAHSNISVVLREMGRLEESAVAGRRAIAFHPELPEAHNNLGVVLEEMGQLDAAMAAYEQAIAIKADYAEAHFNQGNVFKATRQLDQSITSYRTALALKPQLVAAHSNLIYAMHFHPDFDARAILKEQRRWNQQHAKPLGKFIQPRTNDASPGRRLRIGYVSPDLREHPVGRFLLPLLTQHDQEQFEIFAYAHDAAPDEMTRRLRSHVDHWQSTVGVSDSQLAEQIRQDRIDILIDLSMHMARNRLLVFARKPAPVQATWLAYCSGTGLETMDYRLSDHYLDPPDHADGMYVEKTIRLPETYWCYQPAVTEVEINTLPAIASGRITFGCLNNFSKISDVTLSAWSKLLRRVPGSQLLLVAFEGDHRRQFHERLKQDGIDPDRIRFVARVPMSDYLRLYHQIDIALDTFPYGGGTVTCDTLWMGVPVVSLVGKTAVARGGLSILSNVGLPELVARNEEEYLRTASELAGDLAHLSNLRQTLRSRMERSPLMDAPRFARQIEAAYRQMWDESH